ncbi:hypothetical protein [Amycolatopsis azurea]|uniref:Uncharacterized protein n=1 Tax=Amycolatopsis azurea DSM 43854 TaxID=1238180 RepID=M2Q8C0_9PSEU|nr:hypothetical protein [Amycolatopsis azurea]EMD22911.1 hypothetical protein C791_7911 [Amycolatopsis azurea DSM 43854]OOC04275.1 hypothetical protein B0293_23755 [Amycolatopsis azurea DSM 43854]
MTKLRTAYRAAAGAVATFAGHTVRSGPGIGAGVCFVLAGWLVAVPLGLAIAGAFLLWADWRIR